MINEFNVVVCGVGGQGILTFSRILASAAVKLGYNVRVGETLGMSQRGGIVQSFIRFGLGVLSPLIPVGGADVVVSLDYIEALRVFKYASRDSTIIINSNTIPPVSVLIGDGRMPSLSDVVKVYGEVTNKIYVLDADGLAIKAGLPTATNIVLLGFLCKLFQEILPPNILRDTVAENVPSRYVRENILAFDLGFNVNKFDLGL
ncbi:MAG: indolepyruvate oxidoreductase subunit beta [archaeon GBS-70-058]|nr:indolepyruvate oxidoreductase subunit beta [Candidatus Culexarchaeum nevadense]